MSKEKTYQYLMELPEAVETVYRAFRNAKEKVYLVGGCLRDLYYGIPVKDWDMATPCNPNRVKEVLSGYRDDKHRYGIYHFPKGEAFGVISAMPWCGNHESSQGRHAVEVEITTFRKDLGEGRKPDGVEFCDMEEDAKRRDLTINALYYDPDTITIYDYVDGWYDIANRRVRCVGNPMDRFREDPLRVLRFIRFYSHFSAELSYKKSADLDHKKAVSTYSNLGLKGVSPERIREEFIKGITISTQSYIRNLQEANLLEKVVFPGCKIQTENIDYHNTNIILASLLRPTGSDKIEKILNRLTYSTEVCKHVYFYIRFAEEFIKERIQQDREVPYRLKKYETSRNLSVSPFLKSWANTMGLSKRLVDVYRAWQLSTSASEVPGTAGLKGKEIGTRMREYDTESFMKSARGYGCKI